MLGWEAHTSHKWRAKTSIGKIKDLVLVLIILIESLAVVYITLGARRN